MDKNKIYARLASFDDLRSLNSLVNTCGGVPLMKAIFGPFNFPSLMENAVISLVLIQNLHNVESIIGFLSVSDTLSASIDMTFTELLNEVSEQTNNSTFKVLTMTIYFLQ